MKTDHIVPPRAGPPTKAEIHGFHEVRDREAAEVKGSLLSLIGTAGIPGAWAKALVAVAPIAADTAAQVAKALHPESPGGARITKAELRAIAKREAAKIEAALFEAFEDVAS